MVTHIAGLVEQVIAYFDLYRFKEKARRSNSCFYCTTHSHNCVVAFHKRHFLVFYLWLMLHYNVRQVSPLFTLKRWSTKSNKAWYLNVAHLGFTWHTCYILYRCFVGILTLIPEPAKRLTFKNKNTPCKIFRITSMIYWKDTSKWPRRSNLVTYDIHVPLMLTQHRTGLKGWINNSQFHSMFIQKAIITFDDCLFTWHLMYILYKHLTKRKSALL